MKTVTKFIFREFLFKDTPVKQRQKLIDFCEGNGWINDENIYISPDKSCHFNVWNGELVQHDENMTKEWYKLRQQLKHQKVILDVDGKI